MRVSSRVRKVLGVGLAVLVVALIIVRTWVVPALIVGQLQARLAGKVTIKSWWLDGRSAGIVGLTLHEEGRAGSPVFASVERVATDLSLGSLLRGRLIPRRIALEGPDLTFRLARDGRFVNLPLLRGGGGPGGRLPAITAEGARVTFRREGNPDDMVVVGVHARLDPDASGGVLTLTAGTEDPAWGRWDASGRIEPAAGRGEVRLGAKNVDAEPKRLARVPFIPADVWAHVAPRGPADVEVRLGWTTGPAPSFRTRTALTLRDTSARFPSMQFAATGMTGRVDVDGAVVRLQRLEGRSLGGRVAADGTLDFARTPARIDLDLGLRAVNVTETPPSWQLDEAGITGLLTGASSSGALLGADDVDLSGTTGDAVVDKASIQGIPVKSLHLAMHARGKDLQYDTGTPGESSNRRTLRMLVASLPWFHWGRAGRSRLGWDALAAEELVALQAPPKPPAARKEGVQLPPSISTQIELEDVDFQQLVAKAQFLAGFPLPVPITGKLTMKADATIPLRNLRDVKRYAFHGDATLTNASIFKVDFRRLTARLDLADGLLALKDLRGVLADRPDGGPDNPPKGAVAAVAPRGPLAAGEFQGSLRAQLAPAGPLSGRFEGKRLPLGELAAPWLPRPTPLAGLASMDFEVRGDLANAGDPAAWDVSGQGESVQVTYRGAVLDEVAIKYTLKQGHLEVPGLSARLAGRPLSARGGVDLKAPYAFRGKVEVDGWNIASVVALIPTAPQPSPVAGLVTASAEAEGTASPLAIQTRGDGRVDRFEAGPVPLGDVPFRWTTEGRTVAVTIVDAHPFGGKLSARVDVPVGSGRPVEGSAKVTGIDTAGITAAVPGQSLKLTGKADGAVSFVIPRETRAVEASVRLSAPDLTVQGIPAEHVQASVRAHAGQLKYELTAESLGGKIKFLGSFPLGPAAPKTSTSTQGELRVDGFALKDVWKALNVSGLAAHVSGVGAVDANVRDFLDGATKGLWAHGFVELRDLRLSGSHPSHSGGHLRGIVAKSPTAWRIEPLNGELLGGPAGGFLWGTTPARGNRRVGFQLQIERAALARMVDFLPPLSRNVDGFGTLKLSGILDQSLRADIQLLVDRGRIAGLPLSGLRLPAELVFTPSSGTGALNVRHWSARLAGGQVRGDFAARFGEDRSFHGQVLLSGVDLQTITRLESDTNRPPTGRISGRITLAGNDPARADRYRGRVDLDLEDASLVTVPVFREIDKFLGSTRGGLFDQGELIGAIAHRALIVETLALEGRLVQLHVTGTVGFDSQVNLEVLVNTNQIIPETGQALVSRIPGLRDVLGRSDQAISRVGTYLSNRLLKLRVTGTLRNPIVSADPSIVVAEAAVGFFAGVLKLPLGFLR